MPVIDIVADHDALELTITAEFAAPIERVWALYADPRQLEQVWGPPDYPATFVEHRLVVGARSTYFMTGPDGARYCGWWRVTAVDEPNTFSFDDGFADQDFREDPSLPVSQNVFTFVAQGAGTRATYVSRYASAQALQQVLDMGIVEGASAAMGQIDDVLARGVSAR